MRVLATGAVVLVLASTLVACGDERTSNDDVATAQEPESEDPEESATTEEATEEATCKDDSNDSKGGTPGTEMRKVTVTAQDDGLVITWWLAGPPNTQNGFYSMMPNSLDDKRFYQFGVNFRQGVQDGYFVFNFQSLQQENLDGEAEVGADFIRGLFPRPDDLGEEFEWNASSTSGFKDVDGCPAGPTSIRGIPFPAAE